LETVILIVTASCILHNICEERQEDMLDNDEYFDDQNNFQILSNNSNNHEVNNSVRDNLVNSLWSKKLLRDNRRRRYNFIIDSEDKSYNETSE